MLNINTLLCEQSNRTAAVPKTGHVMRTTIMVYELLDFTADFREYRVVETVGVVALRREPFPRTGYYDLRSDADVRACALASTWLAEGEQIDQSATRTTTHPQQNA